MPLGLPGSTMISSWFWAKTSGEPAFWPASVSFFMFASSAEANTSAGAPWVIWVTSAEEAAKLNVILAPGLSASKAVCRSP